MQQIRSIEGGEEAKRECPECYSKRIWKDGKRETNLGLTQRFLCRECGFRFSEKSYKECSTNTDRQLCAIVKAKKLEPQTETKTVAGEAKKFNVEAQIATYLIRLENNGRRDTTVESRDWQIRRLVNLHADLSSHDSVKKTIAALDKSESYKLLLCIAYEGFLEANGLPMWERPDYKQGESLPFVAYEKEIDDLIANCRKKTATLLKLIKETGMRVGEAWQTEWTDFDANNRTIICRNPEKHSRPRIFNNLSPELCRMLDDLPHHSQFIFTCSRQPLEREEDRKAHLRRLRRQKGILGHERRRTANKLKNPRIAKISYKTLRHWKATSLYHITKDIIYVMKYLGHRDIRNTMIYIDLEKICYPSGGEDYVGKVATTREEKLSYIEAGYDHVSTDPDGTQYFRKRR